MMHFENKNPSENKVIAILELDVTHQAIHSASMTYVIVFEGTTNINAILFIYQRNRMYIVHSLFLYIPFYGDSCQFVIYRILCIKYTSEDDSYLYYVIENVFQLLQFHINMVLVGTSYAQLLLLHHMTRGTLPYSVRSTF